MKYILAIATASPPRPTAPTADFDDWSMPDRIGWVLPSGLGSDTAAGRLSSGGPTVKSMLTSVTYSGIPWVDCKVRGRKLGSFGLILGRWGDWLYGRICPSMPRHRRKRLRFAPGG
jgi:hypothetical protein